MTNKTGGDILLHGGERLLAGGHGSRSGGARVRTLHGGERERRPMRVEK